MRLREITASNEVLLKLSETKTDFTETYNELSSILLAARASVGMSHNRGFVNILIQAGIPAKLDYFENNITGLFENIKSYHSIDLSDQDLVNLLNSVNEQLQHIKMLRKELSI
jgi:hypothetical protein